MGILKELALRNCSSPWFCPIILDIGLTLQLVSQGGINLRNNMLGMKATLLASLRREAILWLAVPLHAAFSQVLQAKSGSWSHPTGIENNWVSLAPLPGLAMGPQ